MTAGLDWATYSPKPTPREYAVHLPAGCWLEPELYSDSPQLLFQTAEESLAEWYAEQRAVNQVLRDFGYEPLRLRSEPPVIGERPRRQKPKPAIAAPVQPEPETREDVMPEDPGIPAALVEPVQQGPIGTGATPDADGGQHELCEALPTTSPAVIYPQNVVSIYSRVHRPWLRRVFDKLFKR